jgi:hypothetical protein
LDTHEVADAVMFIPTDAGRKVKLKSHQTSILPSNEMKRI